MKDIPNPPRARKWRLSFGKDPKPTGLGSIASPHAHTKIKADGVWVGYITPPSRFGKDQLQWSVGLMVDSEEGGWSWVFFKARFDTEAGARVWVKAQWPLFIARYSFSAKVPRLSIAALIRSMATAGAPPEAIAIAVEAIESANQTEIERRARRAQAKRRERAATVARQSHDIEATKCDTPSLDKESFPHTPFKEINPNPGHTHARARGTRLLDGWKPETCASGTKAGLAIARRGQEWARGALETFTNHWRGKAGRDACKVDWQATWANWIIEADRRENRNGQRNEQSRTGYGRTADALADFVREAEGSHAGGLC